MTCLLWCGLWVLQFDGPGFPEDIYSALVSVVPLRQREKKKAHLVSRASLTAPPALATAPPSKKEKWLLKNKNLKKKSHAKKI